MTTSEQALIGLDPTSGPLLPQHSQDQPRPRPESLSGSVVGLVANGLGQAEAFLSSCTRSWPRTGPPAAVPVLKGSVSVPPDPADWERITSEATVAITGFGG